MRHPVDLLRVATGAVVVVTGAVLARHNDVTSLERDFFRLVNHLPRAVDTPLRAVMQIGTPGGVLVTSLAALAMRRSFVIKAVAASGMTAWVAAKGLKMVVGRGRPKDLFSGVILHGGVDSGLGYPSGHVAVGAALAASVAPYFGVTGRRMAWGAVVVVGIARMYVGAHLPLDVVGGAALGWAIGAMVHLVFGAPGGQVNSAEVTATLRAIFPDSFSVTRASVDARGSTPFFVETAGGDRFFVKAISRVNRDADVLFKAWRSLTIRGLEDESPFVTPKQQVEHEAFLALLAERAGVRTPAVLTSLTTANGSSLLVMAAVTANSLDTQDASRVTDRVLRDAWDQVAKLHSARIAHRDLRLANLLVDEDGQVSMIDFGFAEASASPRRLAQDTAELLASTATVAGPERALQAGVSVLGLDAFRSAAPLLQPLALSRATRSALRTASREEGDVLVELRRRAAAAVGIAEPELEPLTRIRWQTIAVLVAGLLGVHFLLPQVGELGTAWSAAKHAQAGWLVVAALASLLTYLAAGASQLGSVAERLPYFRTTAVQIAASFANRVSPAGLGGTGVNIRFLQRSGLTRNEAVTAVGVNSVVGALVHLSLLAMAGIVAGGDGAAFGHLPRRGPILIAVVVTFVAVGLLMWSPIGRSRLWPSARESGGAVVRTVRQPSKAALVFGGSLVITSAYVLSLAACLHAVHGSLPLAHVAVVYLGGSALAAAAPTPGGLGALEAALVAGLTGFGLAAGPAIAGVLTFRLLTFWLPALPGYIAFRRLQRSGVI